MSVCGDCGHTHAGDAYGGICIGCPCPNYPGGDRQVVIGVDANICRECDGWGNKRDGSGECEMCDGGLIWLGAQDQT